MRVVHRLLGAACGALLLSLPIAPAHADPWLSPGDLGLRHDIEVLADADLLRGPVTTWPISWPDVARDVNAELQSGQNHPPEVLAALERVGRAARAAASNGFSGVGASLSGAVEPIDQRGFADTPREEGEAAIGGSWLGDRFAAAVRVAAVADPADGKKLRLDGSYVGVTVGNFMISAGAMDRWWGPGWDGSLILSSNARPIPSLTLERNYTDASRWPVLRWFGPWRASLALGQEEGSGPGRPDTRFLAARLNFKPRPWFEFGLSRTAQWCGKDRPCDLDAFWNLLLGRDNRSGSLTVDREPGNQMAGYDFRLRSPWRRLPVAAYGQFIGEDEAGGLPAKFIGLLGLETWGGAGLGSWRVRAEFADTACSFTRQAPQYDCAYRSGLYPQGYSHRGRSIGHPLDNDGRMYSVAALLVRPSGDTLQLLLRRIEFNRDGRPDPSHLTSPAGASDVDNLELQYSRHWRGLTWVIGAGYDDRSGPASAGSDARGFLRVSWGLR